MNLQGSDAAFRQTQMGSKLQYVIAKGVLAPAHTSFLQHVIANQCAHWRGNPFSLQWYMANRST